MPVIIFEGAQLTQDKKEEIVREFTQAAARITGIDPSSFVVYLHENEQDNIGVGGKLLSEILAARK